MQDGVELWLALKDNAHGPVSGKYPLARILRHLCFKHEIKQNIFAITWLIIPITALFKRFILYIWYRIFPIGYSFKRVLCGQIPPFFTRCSPLDGMKQKNKAFFTKINNHFRVQASKEFRCTKCGHEFLAKADYDQYSIIKTPLQCSNPAKCKSAVYQLWKSQKQRSEKITRRSNCCKNQFTNWLFEQHFPHLSGLLQKMIWFIGASREMI